jgi:hypothetical protein
MGLRNTRAICPNCGGKLHTQPRGLGHLTWANSGALVETGTKCQWCHTALSGRVGLDNKAIPAGDPRADSPGADQAITWIAVVLVVLFVIWLML